MKNIVLVMIYKYGVIIKNHIAMQNALLLFLYYYYY